MLFSSITFIYFFLPLTILLYYIVPQRAKNIVLFAMSIIFYAWGEPVYVFLMLAEILAAYVLTMLMQRFRDNALGRLFYAMSIVLPFALLFYYKFSPALPIGISFYTFQIVSYCIDARRGNVALQKNLIKLASYVTLFPQLVAGPIVRYADVEAVINGKNDDRKTDACAIFMEGVARFIIGLSKKSLIANVLGEFVAEVSALPHGERGIALSWAYAAAVALQLYFDFSGYSDMAIGLGKMLGFSFPENFNYPFISKSVSEFWRRWHMTLGAWFRDYVYIPLGGNRKGAARWIANILAVWLFTGLWHGAEWNFVLWGLSFAALLMIEKAFKRFVKARNIKNINIFTDAACHVYMIFVILATFMLFHNTKLSVTAADMAGLFGIYGKNCPNAGINGYILRNRLGILIIALIGATPLPKRIAQKLSYVLQSGKCGTAVANALQCAFLIASLMLCAAYLIDGSFNPFLYFRF